MLGSVREYLYMYKIGSYEIHGPKRRISTVFADLTFTDAPPLTFCIMCQISYISYLISYLNVYWNTILFLTSVFLRR